MIAISLDTGGMHRAFQQLASQIDAAVAKGFEASLESIAARAKQTTKFTDRTGALRNSIQSDGVTQNGAEMVGIVSFAAVSERKLTKKRGNTRRSMGGGFPYGLSQELGSSNGVKAKYFITDAIAAEDGQLIESALRAAFVGTGFEVT